MSEPTWMYHVKFAIQRYLFFSHEWIARRIFTRTGCNGTRVALLTFPSSSISKNRTPPFDPLSLYRARFVRNSTGKNRAFGLFVQKEKEKVTILPFPANFLLFFFFLGPREFLNRKLSGRSKRSVLIGGIEGREGNWSARSCGKFAFGEKWRAKGGGKDRG